jgi:hypothetical protein
MPSLTDIIKEDRLREEYRWGRMRGAMSVADPFHSIVAPLEHREFVEDVVRRNPLMSIPMSVAIPGYSLLKYLNVLPRQQNTSPASWDEVFAGYEGLLRGLR